MSAALVILVLLLAVYKIVKATWICWLSFRAGWPGFFNLQKFLEHALGLPADLVTNSELKNRIKESILTQVIYI
jgi:hypothetical protein